MMELQKRIDILDLWDEMPYSLDIKDFGNTVVFFAELIHTIVKTFYILVLYG